MSTSYGHATVAFPGFPPVTGNTVNDRVLFANYHWGYKVESFLPVRTLKFADGTKRRLSKKERSRLLTLSRKWNKHGQWDYTQNKRHRPFRTIEEVNDY